MKLKELMAVMGGMEAAAVGQAAQAVKGDARAQGDRGGAGRDREARCDGDGELFVQFGGGLKEGVAPMSDLERVLRT
eukprot:11223813-Lingulodinium_polyedra.AAC.1